MRLIEIALFLVPFGAFIVWRFLAAQPGPAPAVIGSAAAGLALLAAALVWFAVREGARPNSVYVPAHMEDGQVIPGRAEPR